MRPDLKHPSFIFLEMLLFVLLWSFVIYWSSCCRVRETMVDIAKSDPFSFLWSMGAEASITSIKFIYVSTQYPLILPALLRHLNMTTGKTIMFHGTIDRYCSPLNW